MPLVRRGTSKELPDALPAGLNEPLELARECSDEAGRGAAGSEVFEHGMHRFQVVRAKYDLESSRSWRW